MCCALIPAAVLNAGCATVGGGLLASSAELQVGELPSSVEAFPADQVLPIAKQHFAQGNFGHAARYYEQAVEIAPGNGEAWLGLAASYDRLRRFDLADRAYQQSAKLAGDRAEYFNNVGYSYLLRGDTRRAWQNFMLALEKDPDNLTVMNNLELLRVSGDG
ncbi:tetratricopeptide repeat protein [Pelagibacterium sp. H642]|uniref:tetratricopeptide repeat protein n=1 Tax=Pelagibacterium sp. H642 TaxID=1881069 RepID=UPI002814D2F5|nr:tetratricopeptide repeat protein [Pelagibacterium sp. H642]WMT92864.1 tetratricopeptide repeat protein [Pelagibacterium sp. H642]